jgi:hypothetical protein
MGKIDHFSGFCAEADKQNADHSALEQIDRELDQQFTNIGSFRSTLQARSSSNSVTASSHSAGEREATNSGSVAGQS